MLVELGGAGVLGQAVEIGEEVNLGRGGLGAGLGLTEQVVNQDFGVDLFLDVEGRRGHDEVGPILRRLCRARRTGGRGRDCGARRRRRMGDLSASRMRDWYSTVGRFLRLASWRRVATVLPLAAWPVDLGLAGMEVR